MNDTAVNDVPEGTSCERVEIETQDGAYRGLLMRSSRRPAPSLILAHEIFGINVAMRRQAAAFARLGFTVLVPELFWRAGESIELDPDSAADRPRAIELGRSLDMGRAVADIAAAAQFLSSCGLIGLVGYCIGGRVAYLCALQGVVAASVSYYPVGIEGLLERAMSLRCPVLVHIAEEDRLCSQEAQASIVEALSSTSQAAAIVHPGVGHAFARPGGEAYNEEAAKRADALTCEFLLQHLTGAPR